MSRVGSNFFTFSSSFQCLLSIGRGGASKRRRLITLISVGWVPPYLHPSGACLNLGARMLCSLLTLTRVTPNRGCASSNGVETYTALVAILLAIFISQEARAP